MTHEVTALDTWQRLMEPRCAELVSTAMACEPGNVAAIAGLRRTWPAPLVRCALELAEARRRGTAKFPQADELVADRIGMEQATSAIVADHKAERFRQSGIEHVKDLCSGIGGDAMSLARVANVEAFELDPVRCWMTECNARCPSRVADVTALDLDSDVVHFDPSRRRASGTSKRQRSWSLDDYEPGSAFLEGLVRSTPSGATKLGPGADLSRVEILSPDEHEVELISEHGRLTQAVLWHGRLAWHRDQRTATKLPDGVQLTGMPSGHLPSAREIGRYLYVADPAAERAALLGLLCERHAVSELHPGLGILTGDQWTDTPWLRSFEIVESGPWRVRSVKRQLFKLDAGVVEVKTRGKAVDPDVAQRQLRGEGDQRLTVFVLRMGQSLVALVTRRCDEGPRGHSSAPAAGGR